MTRTTPPAHFRPQSERQRREVLRRIDAAEFEALQAMASQGHQPMTPDPYRLRTEARKPVLRVVQVGGDQVQGNAAPRAAYPIPQKPEPIELVHRPPSLNAFERRAVISVAAIYIVVLAGLVATAIHFRT